VTELSLLVIIQYRLITSLVRFVSLTASYFTPFAVGCCEWNEPHRQTISRYSSCLYATPG